MQRKNSIKTFLFLFAILFSFAVNAYNSLHTGTASYLTSKKTIHIAAPSHNDLDAGALVFEEEENENDTEDLLSQTVLILASQDYLYSSVYTFSCKFLPAALLEPPATPLYLSNGVLLI